MSSGRKILISYGENPVRTSKLLLSNDTCQANTDLQYLINHMFPIVTRDKKTLANLGGSDNCCLDDLIFFTFDPDFNEEAEVSGEDILPDKAKVTLKLRAGNQLCFSLIIVFLQISLLINC